MKQFKVRVKSLQEFIAMGYQVIKHDEILLQHPQTRLYISHGEKHLLNKITKIYIDEDLYTKYHYVAIDSSARFTKDMLDFSPGKRNLPDWF